MIKDVQRAATASDIWSGCATEPRHEPTLLLTVHKHLSGLQFVSAVDEWAMMDLLSVGRKRGRRGGDLDVSGQGYIASIDLLTQSISSFQPLSTCRPLTCRESRKT